MASTLPWPDLAALVDAVRGVAAAAAPGPEAACTPRSPAASAWGGSFAFGSPGQDPYLLARGLSEPGDTGFTSPALSRTSRSNSFRGTEALAAWLKDELAGPLQVETEGVQENYSIADVGREAGSALSRRAASSGAADELLRVEPRRVLVFDDGEEGGLAAPCSDSSNRGMPESGGETAVVSSRRGGGLGSSLQDGELAAACRARHAACWGSSSSSSSCVVATVSAPLPLTPSAPVWFDLRQLPPRCASVQEALSLVRLLCVAPVALAAMRQPGAAARLLSPHNPRLLLSPSSRRPRRAASEESGLVDADGGVDGPPVPGLTETDPVACIRYACMALEALWPLPIVALSHMLLRALRFVPAVRVELPAFCARVEAALAGGTTEDIQAAAAAASGGASAGPPLSPQPAPRGSPDAEALVSSASPSSPRYWLASPPDSARPGGSSSGDGSSAAPPLDWAALLRANRDADAAEAADVRTIMNQQVNYQAVPGMAAGGSGGSSTSSSSSASRGPLDLSVPFTHEAESRHNLKSRAEVDSYQAREKLRDAFLTLLREYRDAGCTFTGPASPAEVAASIPTRVPTQLKPLLVAHPRNAVWFARLFVHELSLFSVHEAVIGGFMPGGLALGGGGGGKGGSGSAGGSAGSKGPAAVAAATGGTSVQRTVSPSPVGARTGEGSSKAARAAQKAAGERVATTLVADAGLDPSKLEKLSARLAPGSAREGGALSSGGSAALLGGEDAPTGNLLAVDPSSSSSGSGNSAFDEDATGGAAGSGHENALEARMGGKVSAKAAAPKPPAPVSREAQLIMRLQLPETAKPAPATAAPAGAWGHGKTATRLGLSTVPSSSTAAVGFSDASLLAGRPAQPKPGGGGAPPAAAAAAANGTAGGNKKRAVLQAVQDDVKPQGTWAKLASGGGPGQGAQPQNTAAPVSTAAPAPADAAKKRVKLVAQPVAPSRPSGGESFLPASNTPLFGDGLPAATGGAVGPRRPYGAPSSGPRAAVGGAFAAPVTPLAALLPDALVSRALVGSEALFWGVLVHMDCSGLWAAVRGQAGAEIGNACHAATLAAHLHKHGHKTVFLYVMRLRCLARLLALASLAELLPGLGSPFPAEVVAVRDAIRRSPPPLDVPTLLATAEQEGTLPVVAPVLLDALRTVDACVPPGVPLPTWVGAAGGLLLRVAERAPAQNTQAVLLALCVLELHTSCPRVVEEAARAAPALPLWPPPPAPTSPATALSTPSSATPLVIGHRLLLSVSQLYRATVSDVGSATTALARAVAVPRASARGLRASPSVIAASVGGGDGRLSPASVVLAARGRGASDGEVEVIIPASLPGSGMAAAPATPSRASGKGASSTSATDSATRGDGLLVDTSMASFAVSSSFSIGSPSAQLPPRKIVPTLVKMPSAAAAGSGTAGHAAAAEPTTVLVRVWGKSEPLGDSCSAIPPAVRLPPQQLPPEAAQLAAAGPLLPSLQASLESAFARANPVRYRLLEALAEAAAHDLGASGSGGGALRLQPAALRARVEGAVTAVLGLSAPVAGSTSSSSSSGGGDVSAGEVLACSGIAHRMLVAELERLGVGVAEVTPASGAQ